MNKFIQLHKNGKVEYFNINNIVSIQEQPDCTWLNCSDGSIYSVDENMNTIVNIVESVLRGD